MDPSPVIPTNEEAYSLGIGVLYTHVQKARKARPEHGIAVGDAYFWWHGRTGKKFFSKEQPDPSLYLWPERWTLIETRRAWHRSLEEAQKANHLLLAQQKSWTQGFLDEFFGGHAPGGSWDGQKAANWQPEDGGPQPRAGALVFVCHEPFATSHHFHQIKIGGQRAEVAAYVQHVVLSDTCTPYYDYMRKQFSHVESIQPFVVVLRYTTYAGD